MSAQPESVFVTGATGYIAQHIVKQLLEQGYSVIGSVRSEEKGKDLKLTIAKTDLISDLFHYVVVPNIIDKKSFDEVFDEHPEIRVVLHTASPVDFTAKDAQKDIIEPAVLGTKNILQSAKEHSNIKHVVITSSAVSAIDITGSVKPDDVVTENSWSKLDFKHLKGPEDASVGYGLSKTFAGKEVDKFIENEKPNFTIASILPPYVLGPQAFEVKDKSQLNFSAELVNKVLKLKPDDKIPEFVGFFVDVRDVAHAHIKAIESSKETNGKRIATDAGSFTNEIIATIINKHFPQVHIPEGSVKKSNEQLKDKDFARNFSKSEKLLGFDYIPLEKTIVDSVQQILVAN
ncbi:hypothetical protein KGF54_003361 [Candida jiufengensis]|uniref:uncharacterized protein n=1 Tax=Candida jiufengensis TaxID=497108 RepID=UPI002224F987|nr:uncharacterized protein KGF54_003361 [Candida jiufengensis]KAI5952494.1 hypothetical protein KGF54_003361 [Candida jiufengensis]